MLTLRTQSHCRFCLEAWRRLCRRMRSMLISRTQLTRQLDLAQLVGEWSRRLVALRELKLAQSLVGASESIMRPGESDKAIAELIWLQLAQRNQDPDASCCWPRVHSMMLGRIRLRSDVREYWSNAAGPMSRLPRKCLPIRNSQRCFGELVSAINQRANSRSGTALETISQHLRRK